MTYTTAPELPSNRKFGSLFIAVFAGLCIFSVMKGHSQLASLSWGMASILVALITALAPALLAPLNRAWFQLGLLLGKIVSPIVLGVIFFGILTPVAIASRLFGRDELRLKRQPGNSYWIKRDYPTPIADTFKNQF